MQWRMTPTLSNGVDPLDLSTDYLEARVRYLLP